MRNFSLYLLAAAALTLLLLVLGAPAHLPGGSRPWLLALGFQLPALWTLLALVSLFRAIRAQQPVPVALYLTIVVTLINYVYFALIFSGARALAAA